MEIVAIDIVFFCCSFVFLFYLHCFLMAFADRPLLRSCYLHGFVCSFCVFDAMCMGFLMVLAGRPTIAAIRVFIFIYLLCLLCYVHGFLCLVS